MDTKQKFTIKYSAVRQESAVPRSKVPKIQLVERFNEPKKTHAKMLLVQVPLQKLSFPSNPQFLGDSCRLSGYYLLTANIIIVCSLYLILLLTYGRTMGYVRQMKRWHLSLKLDIRLLLRRVGI